MRTRADERIPSVLLVGAAVPAIVPTSTLRSAKDVISYLHARQIT
jgi:hypothetical protein